MVMHYQEKERIRMEKEQGEFEKLKQEFELQCARERAILNVEKNLEPKQSTPHFVHPTRYRNRNSFTNTANESNQKLKNGSWKKVQSVSKSALHRRKR